MTCCWRFCRRVPLSPRVVVSNSLEKCSRLRRVAIAFKLNWKEYSRNSVLRYLVEERRPPAEKAFWSLCLTLTLALCMYQMGNLYDQWKSNSVILLTSTSRMPLHELPFPAVSICPSAKTNYTLLNYTEMEQLTSKKDSKSLSKDERLKLSVLSVLCDIDILPEKFNMPTNEEFFNFLKSVVPHMQGTTKWVWFGGDDDNCPPPVPVLSNVGVCYTYNLLPAERRYRLKMSVGYTSLLLA
ncbi:pickpocket protein 28-like [Frankliniella occidentalis]|uniref:Pickpocket protein 28-like n=1 Tax=Frankliniella occidentalis TaxID=133901 RepID=A0A9C6X1C6_FRAOC|nr:pickpocket protein 28-like [Frankliniella occidentalis]